MILVLCCSASCKTPQRPTTAKSAKTTSLSGSFESKRGVIVALSCFCYNGGYLNTALGEEIAICIADDKTEINCKSPTFTGTCHCNAGERHQRRLSRRNNDLF